MMEHLGHIVRENVLVKNIFLHLVIKGMRNKCFGEVEKGLSLGWC